MQKLTSCFWHSKINYQVKFTTTFFSRNNKGVPANVLLLYHGVARQGRASFKAFPGPFWALSRPAPCMWWIEFELCKVTVEHKLFLLFLTSKFIFLIEGHLLYRSGAHTFQEIFFFYFIHYHILRAEYLIHNRCPGNTYRIKKLEIYLKWSLQPT